MTIRTKICCTTYKKICTYQKKVVPLRHEKVNEILNVYSSCMACCTNSHIINLLHSGKFTIVNFTQSKLAKSLHLKIGAKVIKKLNINKLNYKIMKKSMTINHKVEITNNVLGFVYVVLQYTTFNQDQLENEHVKTYCFDADSGKLHYLNEESFVSYSTAKKRLKSIISDCIPV